VRILLGAFGDPGHAFPMLALGRALNARGHEVTLQTWERWREDAEREGLTFAPAPEYHVFPTQERPLKPYEAVVRATGETRELVREVEPDVVVSDVLTLAPALAAELEGVRTATLVPHVDPRFEPGWPPYSVGARLPRTAMGRAGWRMLDPLVGRGLELGRRELDETRRRLGLAPAGRRFGGMSQRLVLVATFPQLEYPRAAPLPGTHVIGPLLWEPEFGEVELPEGDESLVLVAPSTAQDAEHRLLRAAIQGLAGVEGVRVLGTWNRRKPDPPLPAAGLNTRLVEWVSYSRTMPRCDVVVCHGGHGTVVRALASGCVVVVAPAAGDQNENAARVDWAGAGVRIPRRLMSASSVSLAVRRALDDDAMRRRAQAMAAWLAEHDPGERAAELIEHSLVT
jgi:UDP:flavonoid glycosyltransferase YjiC (YdhE family)